jgi:predicted secreted acid phosphatase
MSSKSFRVSNRAVSAKDKTRLHIYAIAKIAVIAFVAIAAGSSALQAQERATEVVMQEPANLGLLKAQLREYMKCCYSHDIEKVAAEAKAYVEQRAPAATKPALVLDIDETSLSNWSEIIQNDFGYITGGGCDMTPGNACGAHAWELSANATAIRPTLELFNAAKAKNVAIFFVTGRPDAAVERAATVENLTTTGYAGWAELVMKPPYDKSTAESYKSAVRARISSQGYTIIANVGDQESDLAGGNSEKVFKLPNPFYFLP